MTVAIIVAMSEQGVIGRENRLPWHLPADLKRFKALTMGHYLILGRKTFESIGRPLPGRKMIVVSRRGFPAPEGVEVASSIDEALALCAPDEEAFVAGGAEVYAQTLGRADRLYVTLVRSSFEGDAAFPPVDELQWTLASREDHDPDDRNRWPYSFLLYERKRA